MGASRPSPISIAQRPGCEAERRGRLDDDSAAEREYSANQHMLSTQEASALLALLCARLGFCLPPAAEKRLAEHPPADVLEFTAAVFIAEGLEPSTADRRIYRQVKAAVAEAFRRSEDAQRTAEIAGLKQ